MGKDREVPEKILVILTGGTIGSFGDGSGLHRRADAREAKRLLFSQFQASDSPFSEMELEEAVVLDVLSEQMTMELWQVLADYFKKKDLSSYRGVVMTHGTDTLAYSAAFLTCLLWDCGRPVCFVSSALPLTEAGANGGINFRAAVEAIGYGLRPGCYVFYQNMDGRLYIHHGARLSSCPDYSDDFSGRGALEVSIPVKREELEKIGLLDRTARGTDNWFRNRSQGEKEEMEETTGYGAARQCRLLDRISRVSGGVMLLRPYPGLDYGRILLDSDVRAVVHGLYHARTSCTIKNPDGSAPPASVLYLLEKCRMLGIPCIFSPLNEDAVPYASADAMLSGGGVGIDGMSLEAVYAKTVLGCSLGFTGEELEAFLREDLCGEYYR